MVIDHLVTPYKLGKPVLTGSGREGDFDSRAVDCPNVFSHNGRYYMTYIGFDGEGYQTGLAVSDDLLRWEKKGAILRRGTHMEWDSVGMAGTAVLTDRDLYGGNRLRKWRGRYWMLYHAYPRKGYEEGSAEIGLAWTEDENLLEWHFHGEPVFSWRDGADWEKGGLYKADFLEHDGLFYLFYNAKDCEYGDWTEQTGAAVSDDLIHWRRLSDRPVLPVDRQSWDSRFASDPQVFYDPAEKQWVMFYYGLGDLSACDGVAVSEDLLHWKKFPCPILTTGKEGEIDSLYAHKPYVIAKDGVLYHFYCAVRRTESGGQVRCISVARNRPWEEETSGI